MPPGSDEILRADPALGLGTIIVVAASAMVGLIALWDFHRRMSAASAGEAVRQRELDDLRTDLAAQIAKQSRQHQELISRLDRLHTCNTEIRERLARIEGAGTR